MCICAKRKESMISMYYFNINKKNLRKNATIFDILERIFTKKEYEWVYLKESYVIDRSYFSKALISYQYEEERKISLSFFIFYHSFSF